MDAIGETTTRNVLETLLYSDKAHKVPLHFCLLIFPLVVQLHILRLCTSKCCGNYFRGQVVVAFGIC